MTDASSQKKSRRRFAGRAAASFAIAGAMLMAPLATTSAQADSPWGPPMFAPCGSKIVQLTFRTSGGLVEIGYNQNPEGVGNYPYWLLSSGTHTINTGEHSIWWSKWQSNGKLLQWSKKCVNFL